MRASKILPGALRVAGLIVLLTTMSACAGPGFGGRWCYWHPYQCGR